MSFFSTDPELTKLIDESWWGKQPTYKDPKQIEIPFFWPLTEQIELDLDYGPTHLHYRAKGIAGVHSMPIKGTIYEFSTVATTCGTATISPSLTVSATNATSQLSIGGISVDLETTPKWYQKVLYKLLGFNWRKK